MHVQPQLLCSAHSGWVNALVTTDGERKSHQKTRHSLAHAHTTRVLWEECADRGVVHLVAGAESAHAAVPAACALRRTPGTPLCAACAARSLRAQRRVAFSLWPHPMQPARRVWPERGPHPRGLWSDKEVGAARLGTLPAGALGTSYHALWRCGFEVVACAFHPPPVVAAVQAGVATRAAVAAASGPSVRWRCAVASIASARPVPAGAILALLARDAARRRRVPEGEGST